MKVKFDRSTTEDGAVRVLDLLVGEALRAPLPPTPVKQDPLTLSSSRSDFLMDQAGKRASYKFRLRTTLVVPFVFQVIMAVGVVGYLSFRNGQRSVENLATQLSQQASSRVMQQLDDYLAVPRQVNVVNAEAIDLNLLNPEDFETTRRFFIKQMQVYPDLSYLAYGSQSGHFIGIGREDTGALYLERIQPSQVDRIDRYALNGQGNPTRLLETDTYQFQADEWYASTVAAEQPGWSSIYQWPDRPEILSISANYPLYDAAQRVQGVLSVDFILSQISQFLRQLQISPTGKVFVIERDGMIVASSGQEQPYRNFAGKAERLNIMQSQEPLLRQTAQQLRDRFGSFDRITTPHLLSLQLNPAGTSERTFVSVTPWQDDAGLNWLVVVAIPESDFMAEINDNTRNTIWLCLAALGLAIASGVLSARWVARPILRVSRAANALAQGDLGQSVESSPIIEVDTLAVSFNDMAGQLQRSFQTLEVKHEALCIAEENYRSIFENALEGIFQSYPEGRFIRVNPALARIYGYESPSQMIASITNISEQLYVDPAQRLEFQQLLEQQGFVQKFEYRSYRRDGSMIWTQIDARVVKDSSDRPLYYEGIVQDITERKRREDDLRRQLEELKIEIDQQKREQEVALFTGSSYFQEIQQEMADLNLDEFWG